ncbi:hypothetical protein WICPIJ_001208 [Wickerhamomyces pijperi]|uniref:Uncharacterized protein n=1 Tax=Wickerhamomyces pijperi TaxID=599730 RepID=A0A9P8QBE3_WICPI|nr:hypothetical protein WICPIJ_001208 [Wickerhamomyces pijperi]
MANSDSICSMISSFLATSFPNFSTFNFKSLTVCFKFSRSVNDLSRFEMFNLASLIPPSRLANSLCLASFCSIINVMFLLSPLSSSDLVDCSFCKSSRDLEDKPKLARSCFLKLSSSSLALISF